MQNHAYSKVFMEPNGKIETEIGRREAKKIKILEFWKDILS